MKFLLLSLLLVPFALHAETVAGFDAKVYGFVKASAMYASEALASYDNINLSAPTHAVAQTKPQDNISRMSFQTQQSRVGTTLGKNNVTAKLEFDFIDFNKSSPTTQMVPRVRIASVTYVWDDNKVVIGQDWDMFSPVTTYTFDYVGLYFMAGNTGFMRQQAQYMKTVGDWEYGAALGMAGRNPGVQDSDLETGKSPSYALRLTRKLEKGQTGLSAIYSTLNYDSVDNSHHDSYGFNAFFEKVFPSFSLKSEAYYGQNLANIGTLSIGKGTATSDVKEYGATLTAYKPFNEKHNIFGGFGIARVDNRSDLTPFAHADLSKAITAPGVASNFLTRVGWEYKVTEDFSWINEISRYETTSKLDANSYQTNVVASFESGVQLRF